MDNTQSNIENVTRLWAYAAQTFESYYVEEGFSYGFIPNAEWPNKIWLHGTPSTENLLAIAKLITHNRPELTLIYFDKGATEAIDLLRHNSFKETYFLHGMSLLRPGDLPTQPGEIVTSLEYNRVSDPKDRLEWGRTFQAAFGYSISQETLARTQQEIHYYLLRTQRQTVGTLALFWTGGTAGIYSMGIVPEARGQGYALKAMQTALCQAFNEGANRVVLQASAMGLPMYRKLGFTAEFQMRNYTLK